MAYRNAQYSAFYVDEKNAPRGSFDIAYDMCGYTKLRMWKQEDPRFPFIDAHDKNYNVRDDSKREETLYPRIKERLRMSKTFILFASTHARQSDAISLELEYGLGILKLPLIMVHMSTHETKHCIDESSGVVARELIDYHLQKFPLLGSLIHNVPHCHIPIDKELMECALQDERFFVQTGALAGEHLLNYELEALSARAAFEAWWRQLYF